ncbi:MAG: hypothetical protein K2M17_01575 [Bacilli bacterium]|nr:hypothetical protein [Bacilli bacterium]
MDHNSIIDRNTFEVYTHAEDCPFAFVCDKRIAPVIALLNKKGYTTFASCGGHYIGGCTERLNMDLSLLKEAQNNPEYFIKEIREDSFDCYIENRCTHIYILFSQRYDFSFIPEGFRKNEDEYNGNERITLECDVNYFDDNNRKRKRSYIENELDKKCNILMNWAKNLPDIN